MKTKKSTLSCPNLTRIRKDGNTTRQVDYAIQLLFQGYCVVFQDHYLDGNNTISNKRLFNLTHRRILSEQSELIEIINFDIENSTMWLGKDEEKDLFRVGEWIFKEFDSNVILFRYKGLNDKKNHTTDEYYRLDKLSSSIISYGEDNNLTTTDGCNIATKEQIENVLILVARQKGFIDGVQYRLPLSKNNRNLAIHTVNGLLLDDVGNLKTKYTSGIIYHNETKSWANILKVDVGLSTDVQINNIMGLFGVGESKIRDNINSIIQPSTIGPTNDTNNTSKTNDIEPPLGLIPKYTIDQCRLEDIIAAISRYTENKKEIPKNWLEEYNSLIKSI